MFTRNATFQRALSVIGGVALLVIVVLALPVLQWRTGEVPQPALHYAPAPLDTVKPVHAVNSTKVWIDAALVWRRPGAAGRSDGGFACFGLPRRESALLRWGQCQD